MAQLEGFGDEAAKELVQSCPRGRRENLAEDLETGAAVLHLRAGDALRGNAQEVRTRFMPRNTPGIRKEMV